MNTFTKRQAEDFRKRMRKAAKQIADELNLEVDVSPISYGADMTCQVSVLKSITAQDGRQITYTQKMRNFKAKEREIGLPGNLVEKVLRGEDNKRLIIKGYVTSNKKYKIEYTLDGSSYKCTMAYIKSYVLRHNPQYAM